MKHDPYKALAYTVGIHFFIMYALTYAAVYTFNDIFLNLNRFYMATIMVAPMVILMLFFMSHMYEKKQFNMWLYGLSIGAFLVFFLFIRNQVFIGNTQFLRSMISHHSSAIVMCERSTISDPEIIELCGEIVETQKEEIHQMKQILQRIYATP